jgi:3-oxoacyl-[acyl-carrier protein] reductase
MDLALQNKRVFVAGSSRGIGYTIARTFLQEGCRALISGRNAANLDRVQAEFGAEFGADRVLAQAGDLSDPQIIQQTLDTLDAQWGGLDCLVANIGSGRGVGGYAPDLDEWSRLFGCNFWPGVALINAALPTVLACKGSIILVASIAGRESSNAPLPYSAAKAALIAWAKNLANRIASQGVRVNCVAPGNVYFSGSSWESHLERDPEGVRAYIDREVPMQRFGTPEEIADVVVYLSSPRASFITGTCVVADGGQTRSY